MGSPPPVSGLWHQEIKHLAQVLPKLADMTHAFETFNANQGKRTLQRRLQHTRASVVMMQEIGYHADECESLRAAFFGPGMSPPLNGPGRSPPATPSMGPGSSPPVTGPGRCPPATGPGRCPPACIAVSDSDTRRHDPLRVVDAAQPSFKHLVEIVVGKKGPRSSR